MLIKIYRAKYNLKIEKSGGPEVILENDAHQIDPAAEFRSQLEPEVLAEYLKTRHILARQFLQNREYLF